MRQCLCTRALQKKAVKQFPLTNVSVVPRKGDAVLFYNCLENSVGDSQSLHGGLPVKAGEVGVDAMDFGPSSKVVRGLSGGEGQT